MLLFPQGSEKASFLIKNGFSTLRTKLLFLLGASFVRRIKTVP